MKTFHSITKRVEIIKLYFQNISIQFYSNTHSNENVNHSNVGKLVQKFINTRPVCNVTRQPHSDIRNESVAVAVLRHGAWNTKNNFH